MKTFSRSLIQLFSIMCLLTLSMFFAVSANASMITFEKTYGGPKVDVGRSVQQTSDGGYIMLGYAFSITTSKDMYLVKTDATGTEQWSKVFNESGIQDGYSVQQTTDGGYILLGYTGSSGMGSYDMYLVKTDSVGNKEWEKTFGEIYVDRGVSVKQTADGGYILFGDTYSNATRWDMFAVKTDANGDEVWRKKYGGSDREMGTSVMNAADGGYLFFGYTSSFGAGSSDMYLVKTDANGDELWSKTYGVGGFEAGFSVAGTSDGGYILLGITGSIGAGSNDMYLVKADASGNKEWEKAFGGGVSDMGYSVQQTSDGGYVLMGQTASYGSGYSDMYLVKTDSSGNESWSRTFGGYWIDYCYGGQQTADDGFVLVGFTPTNYSGPSDIYLVKTDPYGNINPRPVADAGSDQNKYLNQTVSLDGSGSFDPYGGEIVSYTWRLLSRPVGSTAALSSTSVVNPTITPDVLGNYIISLYVSNGSVTSATDNVIITVSENLPPEVVATGAPSSGAIPLVVSLDASGSSDPENGTLTYLWDFGDGTPSSTEESPSHTYTDVGKFTAVVTVTDDYGNSVQGSVSIDAQAENYPPSAEPAATPVSGISPLDVQFTANASDPNGDILTYEWDFGDGTPVSGETDPAHTYTAPGTYVAEVTVSDTEFSATGSVTICVDSALAIDVNEAKVDFGKTGAAKGKISFKATFDYTGLPDAGDLIIAEFDGISLFSVPFSYFGEEDTGVYVYNEKYLHVKIDFNQMSIMILSHKMILDSIDDENVGIVVSFNISAGSDHIVMESYGTSREGDKKLLYKKKAETANNDDIDGDGYTVAEGDCDNTDPSSNPGALEIYDGVDNDCDGQVDEDPV